MIEMVGREGGKGREEKEKRDAPEEQHLERLELVGGMGDRC